MGWRWSHRRRADGQRRATAAAEFLADVDRRATGEHPVGNLVPYCVQKRRSDRLR